MTGSMHILPKKGRRNKRGTGGALPQYFDQRVAVPLNIISNFRFQLNVCPFNIFYIPMPLDMYSNQYICNLSYLIAAILEVVCL